MGAEGGASVSAAGSGAGGTGVVSTAAGAGGSDIEGGGGGPTTDLKENGLPCSSNDECASAVCQDEVCCDKACDGTCEACAEVHTGEPNGTCAPALAGSDPHDSCEASAGTCGTSCPVVANQTRACRSGKCEYACTDPKYTLTCSPSSSKTACSRWDFEVPGETDGWFLQSDSSNGSNGPITSSNKFAFSGNRSLAIPYTNAGFNPDTGDYRWIKIAVKVCANGGEIDLTGKRLTFMFRMDPVPPSTRGYNYFFWTPTGGFPIGNHDFLSVPENRWWSSTEYHSDVRFEGSGLSAPEIGFHLQVDDPWTGTLYLDDIQIY